MTATLDVVVPALNAAPLLARTLAAIGAEARVETGPETGAEASDWRAAITVCDGGSHDDTRTIARNSGAAVVSAPAGRGGQLAAGAAAGSAPWLLFLHADTVPEPGWAAAVRAFTGLPANATRAGYFRLRFDSSDPRARRIERLVAWRCRTFGLPYGDQGLLIARAFYDRLGGFGRLPLMEDVDIVRRIGRANLVPLDAVVTTSAQRYERDGWHARPLRNLSCLALYLAGTPPHLVARLYGR